MRVIVTGSRRWNRRADVFRALRAVADSVPSGDLLTVVHGACPNGADAYAARWCRHWVGLHPVVIEEPHPADWSSHGKRAGYLRNQAMADLGADLVLAFHRGDTAHMIRCAEKAGIPVKVWTMP